MRAILFLAVLCPLPLAAADLSCKPDVMCIDTECEAGHQDKALMVLRGWDAPTPVLHSREGDVPMVRSAKSTANQWSGRDEAGNMETLVLRPSDMRSTLVIQLEPVTEGHSLTLRGVCAVVP